MDGRGQWGYREIAADLREHITRGAPGYRPGEELPGHRTLAEDYAVAPGTIRQATGLLRTEGLLRAERRRLIIADPGEPGPVLIDAIEMRGTDIEADVFVEMQGRRVRLGGVRFNGTHQRRWTANDIRQAREKSF